MDVCCHLDEVRHPDTVAEDAVGAAGVALDHVVVHGVKQRDHGVVGVGTLDLVRVPLVETELTIPAQNSDQVS